MLLLNWEIFNPNEENGKYAAESKDYITKTKELKRKYADLGVVRIVNTQEADDLKGQPLPSFTIPLTARDGLSEWAYTDNMSNVIKNPNGGLKMKRRARVVTGGSLMLNVNDNIDLLYFITEKSPLYKTGKIKIDDAREAAKAYVKEKQNKARLDAAIYSETSPLVSELMLRKVCNAVGIKNAQTVDEFTLRKSLEDYIKAEEAKNKVDAMGITRFLEFIHMDEEIIRRGFIQKAIDKNVLKYDDMGMYVWGGDETKVLCKVPPSRLRDKFAFLCEWFTIEANKASFDELEREVMNDGYLEQNNDYDELKFLCKNHGIRISGVSKDNLTEKLKELFFSA